MSRTKLTMKISTHKMHEQFVVNEKGQKTAVVLDLKEYQEWKEDYEDLVAMLEAKDEPRIPWEQVKEELLKDGLL